MAHTKRAPRQELDDPQARFITEALVDADHGHESEYIHIC